MLTIGERILFIVFLGASLYLGGKGFLDVYKVIARGKPDPRFDHLSARIRRALGIILTQRSLFKARPVVSFLHALIFYGFIFYFLVNLVDVIDGFFWLDSRGGAWNAFNLAGDLLSAGILAGVVGLFVRRRIVKPEDFDYPAVVPLQAGARAMILRDSTIVSVFILVHVGCRVMFKATQLARQGADAYQPVASLFSAIYAGMSPTLMEGANHVFWWGALGAILVFIPYFPRSKHIHLFMAPVNLALRKDKPGVLQPMDFEKEEIFGAAKLEELTWPRL
jgi:hypothetical protein